MPKVLGLIFSCQECPQKQYRSGGGYDCMLTKERIPELQTVAPFCPLADYPSRVIADMAATLKAVREQETLPFSIGVLSLIAAKLKTNVRADFLGIDIPLTDGKFVYLPYDSFSIDLSDGWTIHFEEKGLRYQLRMRGNVPLLLQSVSIPGMEGEYWQECDLAP